jgi:hypothetical protein
MAQTIKTYNEPLKLSIGGRFLTVTELTLGTEYLTEGFVLEPLKLGFPVGLVDAAWCCNVAGPAKEATGIVASINLEGEAGKEDATLKLQLYNTKTLKETELSTLTEEASKGAKASEYKVVIAAIGR